MKEVSAYPITTPYGIVPGYPLNGGFHRGEDRAAPQGTPVIVNGVTIGLVGTTGASTGSHLHLGKWVNGIVMPPNGQGFTLKNPYVDSTGYDSVNGNYIRLKDSNGVLWVYLHLSKVNVIKGQVLKEDEVPARIATKEMIQDMGRSYGWEPTPEYLAVWVGRDAVDCWYDLSGQPVVKQAQKDKYGSTPANVTKLGKGLYEFE